MPRSFRTALFLFLLTFTAGLTNGCKTTGSSSELRFYGKDSRRAHMIFSKYFYFRIPEADRNLSAEEFFSRYQEDIEAAWETQLAHMFGAFTQHEQPTNFQIFPGIPREMPRKKVTGKRIVTTQQGRFLKVEYEYYDIVVFSQEFLNRGDLDATVLFEGEERPSRRLSFYLPKEPGADGFEIYQKGCRSGRANKETGYCVAANSNRQDYNLCTDLHYNGVGDFWYFWNPRQKNTYDPEVSAHHHPDLPDCSYDLETELVKIDADLIPINNTGNDNPTFPDYFRLYGEDDRNTTKEIVIHFLIGIDESFSQNDLARLVFNKASALLQKGENAIAEIEKDPACLQSGEGRPDTCMFTPSELEIFRRPHPVKFEPITDPATIRRVFGDELPESGRLVNRRYLKFVHPDRPFVAYLVMQLFNPNDSDRLRQLGKRALEQADIFIYDGHSGLGGYFAIDNFFGDANALPKDKYQILFFNGCSTFSYYNINYFNTKVTPEDPLGYENLDIITNGIGAAFTIGAGTDSILLRELLSGTEPSWINILDTIYSVDRDATALTQINGDENNPRLPVTGTCPLDNSFKPLYDENQVRRTFRYEYTKHQNSPYCRPQREIGRVVQ